MLPEFSWWISSGTLPRKRLTHSMGCSWTYLAASISMPLGLLVSTFCRSALGMSRIRGIASRRPFSAFFQSVALLGRPPALPLWPFLKRPASLDMVRSVRQLPDLVHHAGDAAPAAGVGLEVGAHHGLLLALGADGRDGELLAGDEGPGVAEAELVEVDADPEPAGLGVDLGEAVAGDAGLGEGEEGRLCGGSLCCRCGFDGCVLSVVRHGVLLYAFLQIRLRFELSERRRQDCSAHGDLPLAIPEAGLEDVC